MTSVSFVCSIGTLDDWVVVINVALCTVCTCRAIDDSSVGWEFGTNYNNTEQLPCIVAGQSGHCHTLYGVTVNDVPPTVRDNSDDAPPSVDASFDRSSGLTDNCMTYFNIN